MNKPTAVTFVSGALVGLALGMPVGALVSAPEASASPGPGPFITEDDPAWDCRTMGDQVCGPTNVQGVAPGLYDDRAMLVSAWPTIRTCQTFILTSCTDAYVSPALVRITGWAK